MRIRHYRARTYILVTKKKMDPKIKRMFLNVDEKFSPFQSTPMCNFFRDKTVFLTGSTGMVGQLIVEKLLR